MNRVFVIAEAGVNHNGSLELARQLIDVAADAGADAVKFQTFNAKKLVTSYAPKAQYQKDEKAEDGGQQLDMLRAWELDLQSHIELSNHCKSRGIEFLSTPFDEDSLQLLVGKLALNTIKISSGDLTNGPLLLQTARRGLQVILSTGMSTLAEIEVALSVLSYGYVGDEPWNNDIFRRAFVSDRGQEALRKHVSLLHCTTEYPTAFSDVNLKAMDTLGRAFGLPVGLSDHTEGIAVTTAAVALGATIIEKHFTLDKELPGPDHKASLNPNELVEMVKAIRAIEQALGCPIKRPSASELRNQLPARKSIVASRSIKSGECFSEENITVKRPGDGLSPMMYWSLLGRTADKDYAEDEQVRL